MRDEGIELVNQWENKNWIGLISGRVGELDRIKQWKKEALDWVNHRGKKHWVGLINSGKRK